MDIGARTSTPWYPGPNIRVWISRPRHPRPDLWAWIPLPSPGQYIQARYPSPDILDIPAWSRPRYAGPDILVRISTPRCPEPHIWAHMSEPRYPSPAIQVLISRPGYLGPPLQAWIWAQISGPRYLGPDIHAGFRGPDVCPQISRLDIWATYPGQPDIQTPISEAEYPGLNIRAQISGAGYSGLISGPGYRGWDIKARSRQDIQARYRPRLHILAWIWTAEIKMQIPVPGCSRQDIHTPISRPGYPRQDHRAWISPPRCFFHWHWCKIHLASIFAYVLPLWLDEFGHAFTGMFYWSRKYVV